MRRGLIKGKATYFRDKDAILSFRNHFWQVAHEKVVFEYEIVVFDHAPTSYRYSSFLVLDCMYYEDRGHR